ncbi:type VI secretion system Vgr family protein, partial [Pseudomonas sp. AU11447]|uniref:type VI secretion system Vgr family protein n=2 Tax=unclassified Pseudomonas TaxID=196821 RepID=UPI0011124695
GHLVDAKRQKRGDGFELRTDGWGSVRAGKGVFISADAQPGAQGQSLEMQAALRELRESFEQLRNMARDAALAIVEAPDLYAPEQLKGALDLLQQPGILASAPDGIALTSGHHLQIAAAQNLIATASGSMDVSVVKRFTAAAGENISLFVRKLGMKLFANQGAVQIQAQNDRLELLARKAVDIVSTESEIHLTAKKRIVINAGGSYIRLDACGIEYGTQGDHLIKSAHSDMQGPAKLHPDAPWLPRELNDEATPKSGYPLSL